MLLTNTLTDIGLNFDACDPLDQIRDELYGDPNFVMKAISNKSMPEHWELIAREIGLALKQYDGDKLLKVLGDWAIDYIEQEAENKLMDKRRQK